MAVDTTSPRRPTYIGRLILGLHDCLHQLGANPTNQQLEHWAIFIHESMSTSTRNYHSVKHVFDVADGWDDPIGVLSAYFHDCIYYLVDGGFSSCQTSILKNVMETKDEQLLFKSDPDDELLIMCLMIFGLEDGQDMAKTKGLNEFLSALIACRELKSMLPKKVLAMIACCIEATIAFRPVIDGKTPSDRLHNRMVITNNKCRLGLSEEELVEAVQRAIILSNRDLGNFGSEDRFYFLDSTWSLLPELNNSLRHQHCYSVTEFQEAIVNMNGFLSFLQVHMIFGSFRGVPSQEDIELLETHATRNLEIGRIYLGAKVLAISMLAAFAELTGGDAPMSLFLGDLPSRHHVSRRLSDCLPEQAPEQAECDMEIYNILQKGRKSETSFDIRQSPLAAYLYGCMGNTGIKSAVKDLKLYPMTADTAHALLRTLPQDAVVRIGQNMADVALSRHDLILRLVYELVEEGGEGGMKEVEEEGALPIYT
jgi:hypothetical protein